MVSLMGFSGEQALKTSMGKQKIYWAMYQRERERVAVRQRAGQRMKANGSVITVGYQIIPNEL
jgi:hypothetical protein